MSPAVRSLLEDIVAYGVEARSTAGDLDAAAILADRLREHAVLRTLQIVGEASARLLKLSPDGVEALPLRGAVGFRNILVHGYAKVRMEQVLHIVRHDLPELIEAAERMLADAETNS
jgi:uncharacterized protein with HEPN domain